MEKKLKKIIVYIALFIILVLFLLTVIYTSSISATLEEKTIINQTTVLDLLLSFVVCYLIINAVNIINRKFSKNMQNILKVLGIILYCVASIFWIKYTQAVPVGDQKTINDDAIKVLNNGLSSLKDNKYYQINPQQLGIVYFISILYRLFNTTNYRLLQVFNLISNLLIFYAFYKINKDIIKGTSKSNILLYILFFMYIPLCLLTTFVYADYIAMTFAIWSIYFLMYYFKNAENIEKENRKNIKYIIFSTILMSISLILKINFIIYFIAAIIYFILNITKNSKFRKKYLISLLIYSILILMVYRLFNIYAYKKIDYDYNKATPANSYFYMAMSETSRANGWYNGSVAEDVYNNPVQAKIKYKAMLNERIKYMCIHPLYAIKFYSKKIVSLWCEPTFQSIWYNMPFQVYDYSSYMASNKVFNSLYYAKLHHIIIIIQKAIQLLVYYIVFRYLYDNRKNIDNIDNSIILVLTIFIGGFLFYNLWEGKSRYVIPYFLILYLALCKYNINDKKIKYLCRFNK